MLIYYFTEEAWTLTLFETRAVMVFVITQDGDPQTQLMVMFIGYHTSKNVIDLVYLSLSISGIVWVTYWLHKISPTVLLTDGISHSCTV